MEEDRKAVMAQVTGRVQGVCFRAWTLREAQELGLTGWVRNEPDGSVSALLVGPEGAVTAMLGRLWKGPPGALVRKVEFEDVDPKPEATPFRFTIAG